MSLYNVKLMPQAQKDLDSYSGKLLLRFKDIILGLYEEPRPVIPKNLKAAVQNGVSEQVIIECSMKLMPC